MGESVGLYIHIPFCKQKCFYCDFPSFSGKESFMINYAKALSKEICGIKNKIGTIFIGGGTPTYLSLDAWKFIKEALDGLNKEKDLEFTVEGNPGTFTEEKIKFFKEMGVNRLSIGLQAWQDDILKTLGRIHTLEDFKNSYKMARDYGFKNINIDLMFGLPNQSLEDWKETLRNVINMEPEHLSCYSLIVEEGTAFYKNIEKLSLPSEEEERSMYIETVNFLKENLYEQYEISNFARQGKKCRHNLIYWNLEEYIGCGSGAHSYLNDERYYNQEDICHYIELMESKNSAQVDKHKNSTKENMEEYAFMGLRKIQGISKKEFKDRYGIDIYDVYGNIIDKYKAMNLMIEEEDRIFLSEEGIQVSNVIMSDFMLD
ncbi:radical SAM family heme chaperone HemW [Haloimpatiens lingqiaonensis]|uniref:radical SAM family heme chaperone HemW n=1 Tax=Haloimpatiens lingqiaonensis TaxID=1380675 RepID=UPI0010FDEA1F|nr:radical SAM family heme chaperone HemW [Haloimpatiens lingqiaonensis]